MKATFGELAYGFKSKEKEIEEKRDFLNCLPLKATES
jgi:hypothetical protein